MDKDTTASSGTGAIIPIRQQTVDFYGDQLLAAETGDAQIYVPLRPVVEALGLDWSAQSRRLRRDPILAEGLRSVAIMATEGYPREVLALPLDLLPGWLFGLQTGRVRPELQDKITRYRRECYRVLWSAFKGDILPPAPPATAPALSSAARTLELAEAVYHLARQQYEFEQALYDLTAAQSRTDERLTALELHLSAGATISADQAAELALAVKIVAAALEQTGAANGYQRVYSELYRRERISSYKSLPSARYEAVLAWLYGWYEELRGPTNPL